MKKKWLIAAVCVLMLVLTACSGGSGTPQAPAEMDNAPTAATETAAQPWESNILRSDTPNDGSVSYSKGGNGFELKGDTPYYAFGSEYRRDQIHTIHFLDTLTDAPENAWDVSEAGNGAVRAWVEPNGELYDLYIGAEGGVNAPEVCAMMFFGYVNAEQIEFGSAFHTAKTVDMGEMFLGCKSLSDLDLSGFDTSKVLDMRGMFLGCISLTSLDLSSFNTSKVEDMSRMFSTCKSLVDLDLSGFDTANVLDMTYMFDGCSSLTSLDLSSFDTSNVQEMPFMFMQCQALTDLILSDRFVTANANARNIFLDCPAGAEWGHLSD